MKDCERRACYVGLRAVEDGAGYLEGYASVKHERDSYGDVIEDGAYRNLDALVRDGFAPVAHDWGALPVATIEEATEDERGLLVRMAFHTTPPAQAARQVVRERLERGKTVGLSIGFYAIDWERRETDGVSERVLSALEVVEVSIVNVPAAVGAVAIDARGRGRPLAAQSEALLADAQDLAVRFADLAALRESEGRALSADNRARIEAVIVGLGVATARMSALLAPVTPEVGDGDLREMASIRSRLGE